MAAASITGPENAAQRKEEVSFDRNLFPDSSNFMRANCPPIAISKDLRTEFDASSSSATSLIDNPRRHSNQPLIVLSFKRAWNA
ncbi:hypothetical protein CEXT_436101 [Caerostris extrusa]|uniref:Uncharacterized protein n=1 Tax=Caerostris extrusa TaxID=172846 RepID=A0AAV4MNX9_CAEEX|nr:hypothetical protein CEXT_436101 [Caerostris extrusa]